MTLKKYDYLLVFDFETTGLSPYLNRIIEVGALLLKNVGSEFVLEEQLSVLVRQDQPLDAKITEITGITDQMLIKDGISEFEAYQAFRNLMRDRTLLIAYNISFDYGFLTNLIRRMTNNNDYFVKHDLLDVMAVYKDRHPYPHRLENASKTYGVFRADAHRALEDVKMTYDVLAKMQEERDCLIEYVNVMAIILNMAPVSLKHRMLLISLKMAGD